MGSLPGGLQDPAEPVASDSAFQQVVRDLPFLPGAKAEELGAGHEEVASHREVSSFSFRQTARALLTPSSWNP